MVGEFSMFGIEADMGLMVTVTGVVVAGFAAVLGIWMERDETKPPRYAYALSALILLATMVSVAQSYLDSKETDEIKEDMARMLQRMDELATASNNPELLDLVSAELTAQTRSHPEVVDKLAQRVSDKGEDPTAVFAKHLDAADVKRVSRRSRVKKASSAARKREAAAAPKRPRSLRRGRTDTDETSPNKLELAGAAVDENGKADKPMSLRRSRVNDAPEASAEPNPENEVEAQAAEAQAAEGQPRSLRRGARAKRSKPKPKPKRLHGSRRRKQDD